MKKQFITAIAVSLLIICFGVMSFASEKGDVNGDGKINAADARIALRISAKLTQGGTESRDAADVDFDGKVTAADARKILRISAGLETDGTGSQTTTEKNETEESEKPMTTETDSTEEYSSEEQETLLPEEPSSEEETTVIDDTKPCFTSVTGVTYKTMKFKWNNVTNADGYEISYKNNSSDSFTTLDFKSSENETELPIERNAAYTVRIRSYSEVDGQKEYTDYYELKELENTYFEQCLYETAHPYLGESLPFPIPKWCCIYTCMYAFRPALEKAGYSSEDVDKLSPVNAVPSSYTLYYHQHRELCTVYTMRSYYNELSLTVYNRTENADGYVPKVGDIVIMNNKKRSQIKLDGVVYPSIDHTAQIIEVYDDGTFLCTEGSITTDIDKGDFRGKIVERKYYYNEAIGSYEYVDNSIVTVLDIIRPNY